MAKAIGKNILLKIQTKNKEIYNLTEDAQIEISKGFNFNRREDYPSYGVVIDAQKIPAGAEVLVHHNSTEEAYRVPDYNFLTEQEKLDGWKVFTIDRDMVFVYRTDGKDWLPCEDFLITKRLFTPYKGKIAGVGNQRVKNRLFVVRGNDVWDEKETDLTGKVMVVTENSDYEIIFHNHEHREERLIRTRHRELQAIDEGLTKKLKKGLVYLGLNETDCKPINS